MLYEDDPKESEANSRHTTIKGSALYDYDSTFQLTDLKRF